MYVTRWRNKSVKSKKKKEKKKGCFSLKEKEKRKEEEKEGECGGSTMNSGTRRFYQSNESFQLERGERERGWRVGIRSNRAFH